MRTSLVALLAVGALALTAGSAGASAKPKLPQPRSTAIKPNVGLGNLRLEQRMRPRPKGWRNPLKCTRISGIRGCIWATRRDALPPQGQMGIRGPFVMVMGRKRVSAFIVGSGGRDADARPLRRWKTREGIGFVFANGVLSSIEMYTCEEYRDC